MNPDYCRFRLPSSRSLKHALAALILVGVSLACAAVAADHPPSPVPYKEIPNPPNDAARHIVVTAQDRGPVWLLTGFLHGWSPDTPFDMISALKPTHWRTGGWPFWYSSTIIATPRAKFADYRDSAEYLGKYLDTIIRLREQGLTFQVLLAYAGPYYPRYGIRQSELRDYYDHIYTLVRYGKHMGAPIDYWEVWNEPQEGPYEGQANPGGFWQGTWQEYLDMWDTTYNAIRAADPDAKIVGPSYGGPVTPKTPTEQFTPFLEHCKEKGQRLDVLSWHFPEYEFGNLFPQPYMAQKMIEEVRNLVQSKYPMLGVKEYHIDEWGSQIEKTGPGTQIATFYYLDRAGIDRAGKAHWTQEDLDGILVSPGVPRTAYWAWKAYSDGTGVRLVTDTNDRNVIAIASRDDAAKTVRALVARSKRSADPLPPVKTVVDFDGLPLSGKAEVKILHLGPDDGPVWADDLPKLTTERQETVDAGRLTLTLDAVAENEVYSIRISPPGTAAREKAEAEKAGAEAAKAAKVQPPKDEKTLHLEALKRAEKAAKSGIWRINCGAALGYTDPKGNGWFSDRMYQPGSFGHVLGGTVYRAGIDVQSTDNPEIYRSELYGVLSYKIGLPNGKYKVRLHFAETYGAGIGRVFDVKVGGKTVLKQFDAFKEAGGMNKAIVKEFETKVANGLLSIDFVPDKDVPPAINGIEVIRERG